MKNTAAKQLLFFFLSITAVQAREVTYYRDIAPMIGQKCLGCHGVRPVGAPFSLAHYEDVVSRAERVEQAIVSRSMPPVAVNNSGTCQSFNHTSWLTDGEIAVMQEWVAQGTPAGDPERATEVPSPEGVDRLTHVDAVVSMKEPYTPPAKEDEIRCFVVDAASQEDLFLTGFNVVPGGHRHPSKSLHHGKNVHHAMVWLPDRLGQRIAQLQDIRARGQGYPCFGSARTTALPVAIWAPGSGAVLYPQGTGVLIPGGRKLILQVHYSNTLSGEEPPEPDQTRVELQLEKKVKQPLEIILAGRTYGAEIPPQQADFVWNRVYPISSGARRDPLGSAFPPLEVYGIAPHMHLYGRSMRVELIPKGSTDAVCAMDAFRWDFGHQRNYFYRDRVHVRDGDQMKISCHYNTMSTDQPVVFGDTSRDEMCGIALFVAWR